MADNLASAALAEIRERQSKASPGPWSHAVEHLVDMDDEPFDFDAVVNEEGRLALETIADMEFAAHARTDVPRLLKAVEAALSFHQPRQLYGMVEDFKGNVICGHGQDYDGDLHFEGDDGLWYCKDKPTVTVCATCCDGPSGDLMAEWECPTYRAILAALTGKEVPDA